jgi:glycosyltransferase involved in cell wall biosynthesis
MRIVNIVPGTSARGGGLFNAAWRHHECLRDRGLDSCVYSRGKQAVDGIHYVYSGETSLPRRLANRVRYEYLGWSRQRTLRSREGIFLGENFSDGQVHDGASIARRMPRYDIAHVHLLDSFIGYRWFFRTLPRSAPVVWTLHDNMPLTGGCQSNFGCDHYLTGCGNCPQLQYRGPKDGSRKTFQRKQAILNTVPDEQITFVSASRVQCEMARSSPMTSRFDVLHVPLSLDIERFRPGDKATAKQALGVDIHKLAVGFAASSLGRPNKGFSVLAQAIRENPDLGDRIVLVLVGMYEREGVHNKDFSSLACNKVALGWVHSEAAMIRAYQAMDVLVAPSYQESCGQTVMEAMACGVPVLGSDIGGIQDQIIEGENGYLFPAGHPGRIAALIERFAKDREHKVVLGMRARHWVERRSSYEVVGARFAEIYRTALRRLCPQGH